MFSTCSLFCAQSACAAEYPGKFRKAVTGCVNRLDCGLRGFADLVRLSSCPTWPIIDTGSISLLCWPTHTAECPIFHHEWHELASLANVSPMSAVLFPLANCERLFGAAPALLNPTAALTELERMAGVFNVPTGKARPGAWRRSWRGLSPD